MNKFQRKLELYVNKYNQESDVAPHFKYNETTYIEPQLVFEIYSIIKQRNSLQSMWEKECDYNRLLRNENTELRSELEYLYQEEDEDLDVKDLTQDVDNKDLLC